MEKIIFSNALAIGDNLVFTVALRELHKQYPEKYQTGIFSYYPEVYENNPYIAKFDKEEAKNILIINVNYAKEFQYKKSSGKPFAQGYITFLNDTLNLNIQLTDCKPEIFLSSEEIENALDTLEENKIKNGFWLLSPGYKQDIVLKNYSAAKWQEFINVMYEYGIEIIQTGDNHAINPRFKNIKSLVGKTKNLRKYFAIASLSKGLIGYPSLQMHLAAALNKPSIVVAGGREGINWNCYQNQQYLHSVGYLNCCKETACWKATIQDCENYNNGIAHCMELISVDEIINCVLKY